MALPAVSTTTQDPGIGFAVGAGQRFLFIGCCSVLATNTVTKIAKSADVATIAGQGPGAEAIAYANKIPGAHGPHYLLNPTGGVAATASSVTQTGTGPAVALSGTPLDRYDAIIEMMVGGALATARFRYSLDGGRNYTGLITTPAGGAFVIPNTGITATFAAGTHVLGTTHTFTSTEPFFTTANLATAITAALASGLNWDAIVLVGAPADAATAGPAMFTALDGHLTTLATNYRFNSAIMDVGIDSTADVITGFDALTSQGILPVYGNARFPSGKPFAGWGNPTHSASIVVGGRAAGALVSESLGRTASGPLRGVDYISYDEFVTQALDDYRICTLRSYITGDNVLPGRYVSFDHIKSAAGSDFNQWPLARVANRAKSVVAGIMLTKILENFPTNSDGTILETAAIDLEKQLNTALKIALLDPRDASGRNPHVSDVAATVDRENNYGATQQINVTTLIRPSLPARTIVHTMGFTSGSVTGETPEEPPEEVDE